MKPLTELQIRRVARKLQIEQFLEGAVLHVFFRSKIDISKISTAVSGAFLIDIFVFSQNRALSRNVDHCSWRKWQMKHSLTTIEIIILPFNEFLKSFNSPQVERNLTSNTEKLCASCLTSCSTTSDLWSWEIRKWKENLEMWWRQASDQLLLQKFFFGRRG